MYVCVYTCVCICNYKYICVYVCVCACMYIYIYFFLLPLQSVRRSNFDKGLHNLITLIQKRHKIMIEMKLLYIYMCSMIRDNVTYECFRALDYL